MLMPQQAAAPSDYTMAQQGYGPRTMSAVQHSQMLAQMLQQLGQAGSSGEIRTPLALGADLAAAIMGHYALRKSNVDVANAIQQDRAERNAQPLSDLISIQTVDGPSGAPAQPPIGGGLHQLADSPGAMPVQQGAAAQPGSATMSTNGLPVPPPPAPPGQGGAAPTPAHMDPAFNALPPVVQRAILGEAGGDPVAQRAVAASIMRRAQETGLMPQQIVTMPGQYEGLNAPWMSKVKDLNPLLQQVSANVAGVQAGPYDSFYSPKAQAALGRKPPAWDNGSGVDIGGNRFFNTGYKAPAGMAPQGQSTAGAQPDYAPQGRPGPLQITNAPQGTPTPSPQPSAPAGMSPPAAGAGAGPAASVPAGPAQPPTYHAPVTQAEKAMAYRLLTSPYPDDQAKGREMQLELTRRAGVIVEPKMQIVGDRAVYSDPYGRGAPSVQQIPGLPVEAKPMMQGDGRGGYAPTPGTGYGAPAPIPGVAGVFQRGPGGKLDRVGDAPYSAPGTTPGIGGVTQVGPDGKVSVIGQAPLDPSKIMELQSKLYDSDEYKKFAEGRSSLVGFRNAVGMGNNGVLDTAAVDSYLRSINPGMGARNTTVQMFLNHLGIPQEVQGAVLGATGNGYLTPQTLNQMDHVMQAYVAAHAGEVQAIHKGHVALAGQYGVPESALGEDIGAIPPAISVNVRPMQPGTGSAQQTVQTAGASAAAAMPRIGEVRKGYRFVGGNPADPRSWAKAQ